MRKHLLYSSGFSRGVRVGRAEGRNVHYEEASLEAVEALMPLTHSCDINWSELVWLLLENSGNWGVLCFHYCMFLKNIIWWSFSNETKPDAEKNILQLEQEFSAWLESKAEFWWESPLTKRHWWEIKSRRATDLCLVFWRPWGGPLFRWHLHLLFIYTLASLHAVLSFPLLQDLVQVETTPVIHKEVFHLNHRLVADHIRNGLEIPSILPYSWQREPSIDQNFTA